METSKNQTFSPSVEQLTLFPEASLANLTHKQVKDLVRKTADTSGQRCIEELEKSKLLGSWGKTFTALLIGMGGLVLNGIKVDLESEGYEVQVVVLPAGGAEAPHQRYRTFIIA